MEKKIIEIGQRVVFDPLEGVDITNGLMKNRGRTEYTGTVVYINEPHRWFEVEYYINGIKSKIGFKFNDLGKSCRICEEGA